MAGEPGKPRKRDKKVDNRPPSRRGPADEVSRGVVASEAEEGSSSMGEVSTYVQGSGAGDAGRDVWQAVGGYVSDPDGRGTATERAEQRKREDAAKGERPLRDLVRGVLGLDGALSALTGGGGEGPTGDGGEAPFRFEVRPQQEAMAMAVADTLEAGGSLLVEAGTGVGKSLAYLVPLLLHSLQVKEKVLVSTCTIALQEQLMRKDLPLLRDTLGLAFRSVLVKGRANYLCKRRLQRAARGQQELFASRGRQEIERIAEWASHAVEGSQQELSPAPLGDVWGAVCAERGNCLGRKCPFRNDCFFQRARERIREADLLVVNHHLLFSDMAIRMSGAGFLPAVAAMVLDEAHTVEDVASDHLGLRVSQAGFEYWMRRLFVPDTGKGLLGQLREGEVAHLVTKLWQTVPDLFRAIEAAARLGPKDSERTLAGPLEVRSPVPETLGDLSQGMQRLAKEYTERGDDETAAELRGLKDNVDGTREELEHFLNQSLEDHVYWLEREGRRRATVLHSAPVEVAPILREELFGQHESVVLTSATMAVSGRLDYACQRLGAPDDCRKICLGSPFDYRRQVRLLAASGGPEPSDPKGYAAAVAGGILRYATASNGRTFALFTSADLLRRAAELLRDPMEDAGLVPLLQDGTMPRSLMTDLFRRAERPYVLFGLDSFWMGVDVKGAALSTVILTRLPFAVPDQPVVAARMRRIEERGGNPFRDYTLPEAILKFRQGFGRLIRSATDTGTIVILDPRFTGKWYGRLFLASLPECNLEAFRPCLLGADGHVQQEPPDAT